MPARPRYRPHSSPILVSPLRSCHNLAFTISPLRPARSGGRRRPPVFWNASSARSPLVPDSGSSIQGEPRRNRRRWTTTPGNGHRDRLLITPGVDQPGVSHFEQEAHEPRRLALPWDQVADPDWAGPLRRRNRERMARFMPEPDSGLECPHESRRQDEDFRTKCAEQEES